MGQGKQGQDQGKSGARLQERDYELLAALEAWGVLGLGQIDGLVFHKDLPDAAKCERFFNRNGDDLYRLSGYKRLSDLKKSGYVEAHFYHGFPMVFTLTNKGHGALKAVGRAQLPGFRRSVSPHLVEHEVLVNAVGLVLAEVLGLRVRTIRQRTAWSPRGGWSHNASRSKVPDLWIADERQPKAVEVELNQKSTLLYPEIWEAYRERLPREGAVLYLAGWPRGVAFIQRRAARLGMEFIYACGLEDFAASCGRAPFLNCEGRTLRLAAAGLTNQTTGGLA
ncbi:MAG: hypothetical protein KGL74_10735 [Elusimicrobia bacterium]|nr:hypothetical protein [Elusimicrobiota bacterium]MDE2511586.1 hypothetical protein [Elusimicrobiota bacterium]